jgi:TrmH family RNA methyltransferase
MAAVYQIPVAPEFPAEGELLVLAAQGVQDPGNLGTMIRIAAACRCDLFAAVDDCADPWSPKVVRASAGLLFAMPVLATDSATLLRLCELSTVQAYAATGEDGTDHRTATVSARALLAIGSEGAGLSKVWTETAQKVTIRMWEGCESLNAAIAAGILTHAFASRLGRI